MSYKMNISCIALDRQAKTLSLVADIDIDAFGDFAEPLAQALDCRVLERHWGADRQQWLLDFEGCPIQLHYEFYGHVCWLSVTGDGDVEVLDYLAKLLELAQ